MTTLRLPAAALLASLGSSCGEAGDAPGSSPASRPAPPEPAVAAASEPARPISTGEESGASAPPRLLLVTLDTTRADHLGCYGARTAKTPCLDELARRGILYERAWTVAPITLSSHVSILSGTYPSAHGVRENGAFEVAPEARLLAEVLRDTGFKTAASVGAFVLDRKFGLNQGFGDDYFDPDASHLGGKWGVIDRPAAAVADDALRFIDRLAPDDRYFLWVHFYDPHYPYQPPGEPESEEPAAYAREITNCDRELRRILDQLGSRGLDRGLIVAVTADHGESLGEHGEDTHGVFVYESTMRVPLVIAPPPPGVAPGTRVRAPVSNADLAATLLERLGLGRALLPDARTPLLPGGDDEADEERALYLESLTPYYAHRQHPLRAVVWKDLKFIETRRPELYSLADDPHETSDLVAARPRERDALAQRLRNLLEEHAPLDWSSEFTATSADHRNLAGLGYATATLGGDPFGDPELPDPKDRIGDYDLTDRIAAAMRDGSALLGLDGRTPAGLAADELAKRHLAGRRRLEEALDLLRELHAGNPKDPMIDVMLSTVQLGLGNYAEAVLVLEKVVAETPHHPINHYNLSNAYMKTGHGKWAKLELEKAVFLEPRLLYALRALAELAIRQGDWAAAAWWLDEIAKCPGQSEGDLAELEKTRAGVQSRLERLGLEPRGPRPFTDEELIPEGRRAAGASSAPPPGGSH